METIKATLNSLLAAWQAKKKESKANKVEPLLKKALTKKEIKHIKFNYFRRGVLGLIVDSSGWLYHLNLKKYDLLLELREGSADIKDIRFRIGEVK